MINTPAPAQRLCEACNAPYEENMKQPPCVRAKRRFCSTQCRNAANAQKRVRTTPENYCPQCDARHAQKNWKHCRHCGYGDPTKHYWTDADIAYLKEHYPTEGVRAVSKALNISQVAVGVRAARLGLKLTQRLEYQTRPPLSVKERRAQSQRMIKNNPMKRPEVAQKVRQWREDNPDKVEEMNKARIKGSQRIQRTKASKLEWKLRGILDDLKITFEPSAIIKDKFIVDIRIDNIIIQADGDYWHGHPRFEPLTDRQIAQQKRDRAQDSYLRKCGYTVIRIWESDMSLDFVINALRDHIALSSLVTS